MERPAHNKASLSFTNISTISNLMLINNNARTLHFNNHVNFKNTSTIMICGFDQQINAIS